MSKKVSYDDALATLQDMFSEIDLEIIKQVLSSKKGHLENTVDALLALSGSEQAVNNDIGAIIADDQRKQDQIKQDAAYAKALQDQYFLRELRGNREFMDRLAYDYYAYYGIQPPRRGYSANPLHPREHHHHHHNHRDPTREPPRHRSDRSELPVGIDDPSRDIDEESMIEFMRKKVSSVSDATKKKYGEIQHKWQERKKGRKNSAGKQYRIVDGGENEPDSSPDVVEEGEEQLLYSDSLDFETRGNPFHVEDDSDDHDYKIRRRPKGGYMEMKPMGEGNNDKKKDK